MTEEEQIKARFIRAVEASPLTQLEIAKAIGCEANAFRQYCSGRTLLPVRYLIDFCRAVKISVDYLLTGEENPILAAYFTLTEEDKRIVDRFLFQEKNGGAEQHKDPFKQFRNP